MDTVIKDLNKAFGDNQVLKMCIRDSPGGAPISLDTECFSMYSLISMRTIFCSSSNRLSARALASSVLPTPVGPKNRKEPMGLLG